MAAHEDRSCDPDVRFKLLSSLADSVVVDRNIPPRRYFRSGVEMDRMATVYLQEGNIENAFTLYMKYIVLFVEKLPKHPLYKQADHDQVRRVMSNVKRIFPITEKLRSSIKELYQKEFIAYQEGQRKQLQEKIEQQKKKEEEEQQRLLDEELRKAQLVEHMAQQQQQKAQSDPLVTEFPAPTAQDFQGDYPTAPKLEDFTNDQNAIPDSLPPPYSPPDDAVGFSDVKKGTDLGSDFNRSDTPYVDRSTKPNSTLDRQMSTPVNGLRRMFVPQELCNRFLNLAAYNTSRNLETCGILTGKLAKNVFHITHLVVPKQTATSDSCTTTNEEEMFDVQDKYDLVTLGWIHTHPSQSSFLSSVDLHTHFAYQVMMPEAIAIVCAPKFNQIGIYRLTSQHGLSFIGSCSKTGFHPHPKEPPLFEESEHVHMDSSLGLDIIDLR